MMISTRGRYALRVLIDLAEHQNSSYIPMKEVAARQDISLNYIERIMPVLTKAKLVDGVHGKGGGYQLTKSPEQYKVGDILRLTEGDLAPVACVGCDAKECNRIDECRTFAMWDKFYAITNEYFDGITLADLMQSQIDI
ncbi:MAG: RrF2 family transcriptional regulator [Oscillospiraceae bacterium]|nr:RrF2 family transcriptional regulator [Oscillospiraceae bacterium]